MKIFEKILRFSANLLAWLSALCISLMMLQVFGDVALKYVFKKPIIGTAEVVAYYYMVAAVFLPLPLVEFRNAGVSVTLFYDMISNSLIRRMMMLIAYIGQVLFFCTLAYQSGLDALEALSKFEILEGQTTLYIWPPYFFLPLGLGVAAIVSLLRFIQILLTPDWEQIVE